MLMNGSSECQNWCSFQSTSNRNKMLKWSILARRDDPTSSPPDYTTHNTPGGAAAPTTSSTTPRKSKRRRSSVSGTTRRRSSILRTPRTSLDALEADKENQFTSTPIKSSDDNCHSSHQCDPLRDVSNLNTAATTTPSIRLFSNKKSSKKRRTCSPKLTHKKKKSCVGAHADESNYFRPFESVDSHIEGILNDGAVQSHCHCKKAPTLPDFTMDYSPCAILSTNCLVESKVPNGFCGDLSVIAPSTPSACLDLPGLKLASNPIKVTPLVKKFLDLRFSKISLNTSSPKNHDNSSYINELSLDQIVDALLDDTTPSPNPPEQENFLNETHEDNIINTEQERKFESFDDAHSSDSGFRSSTNENYHRLEANFTCNCNNNNKTIIDLSENYNERCVDDVRPRIARKRSSSSLLGEPEPKRMQLECTLRRQKCIRRRRTHDDEVTRRVAIRTESHEDFISYMENKDILAETFRDMEVQRNESSILSEITVSSKSNITEVSGTVDLEIYKEGNELIIHVIRCKDLCRPTGKLLNAYVKVSIVERNSSRKSTKNASCNAGFLLQRTPVQADSNKPIFNHFCKFQWDDTMAQKRIHVEVWHRDRITRTSEFLGCMSFDIEHAIKDGISGSFRLLPQTIGRSQNHPITLDLVPEGTAPAMCESQSSVDELVILEELDQDLRKSKTPLKEQQKSADENLFLRYLELDPTEGPDAPAAATQRKATGNKNGRTPFTHTKRLVRPAKSGFGFSVVWTHPPRVERVEKGLPADKAGLMPGDYIIFVDVHNVVTMPEIDILNLIRSYGSQLTLEIFRRNASRNGSVPSVKRLVQQAAATSSNTPTTTTTGSTIGVVPSLTLPVLQQPIVQQIQQQQQQQRRPSTVCSTNTASVEYNRRKLHLPQVTFSTEKTLNNPEDQRRKTIYQLIAKEQQFATSMQFAMTRFVSALAERRDLLTATEHKMLFQNCDEVLRITEDILDHVLAEEPDSQSTLLVRLYHVKIPDLSLVYKRYCSGIKKADCVLVNKTKNTNSDFVRFIEVPAVPRRRPDLTEFIHKPLEHFRDILRLLTIIQSQTKSNHEDCAVINQVVHDLQRTYREITSEGGLMEPLGEGRPLLTVQDVENRLVFTKCKPFVLNKPGRQWIFGGDLTRIEGRTSRPYWTLLFSDLLLFAKVSRDRVLFIIEDPIPLIQVTDMFFNIRKKDTEFRISTSPEGRLAKSPTVHCGPDLTRTPKRSGNKRTVILRAPTTEMKAVWQNLLQKQICQVNAMGVEGSTVSSPMLESPEVPITSSVVTLQSAESYSGITTAPYRRQPAPSNNNHDNASNEIQRQIDALIEHKCKQLSKSNFNSKCNAIHLEKWMKGQLCGSGSDSDDVMMTFAPSEGDLQSSEDWTEEMLRKRSEELQLIDHEGNLTGFPGNGMMAPEHTDQQTPDQSPSKSTESQVTVRSSPLVPETVQVCRQCHKNCITTNGAVTGSNDLKQSLEEDDWQPLLLLGLCATNPAASLVKLDPFCVPPVPRISVVPATPESSTKTTHSSERTKSRDDCSCTTAKDVENSTDESPQTEEHPYHSLSSSVQTLRRFGTVSSLERVGSEEHEDWEHRHNSSESDPEENDGGIDNEAFVQSSTIRHWTTKAGNFVAEKMAFFEDYRTAGFLDKYLKSQNQGLNGEELQEDETSGATSGEEIWGTPTSGGEIDDALIVYGGGKQSPNDGSISSESDDEDDDDTELMMDELLMTPPVTGAIMRGLLPRRTLEPLIEEEYSETTSTTSSSSTASLTEPSLSPEQGNEIGGVADKCLPAAAQGIARASSGSSVTCGGNSSGSCSGSSSSCAVLISRQETPLTNGVTPPPPEVAAATNHGMPRSDSYRKIVEMAEAGAASASGAGLVDGDYSDICFFNRFRPMGKFVNIERVPRAKSTKIFEFFNVRRTERRIYETFPEGGQLIRRLEDRNSITGISGPTSSEDLTVHSVDKPSSPGRLKDKQLDRRFWKQLSKRRGTKVNIPA